MSAAEEALSAAFDANAAGVAPASSAALFDASGLIAWKGTGHPRRDGGEVGRSTVFPIASMTKSFLAALALRLRDEGLLDLDAPITAYVPGARLLLSQREMTVTLHDLLANRSGLPEDNAWGDRHLGASRQDIMALAAQGLHLTAEPGTTYQYSNLGMSFVGRAIEAVVGVAVEQQILDALIQPLGLKHTRFDPTSYADYAEDGALAQGFRTFDNGRSYTREPYAGVGALSCIGGLFSTLDDIARWVAFLGSHTGDEQILSVASRREMQRIHTARPVGQPQPHRDLDILGYGLGLVVEHDRRFGTIVQHSGGLPGFSSHMRWHQATGIGAVAFGNSDAFAADRLATAALAGMLERAGMPARGPWPATLTAADAVDHALREGQPLSSLGSVLSGNVLEDVPMVVREQRLTALLENVGLILPGQSELDDRIISSREAAELAWTIACQSGALRCEITMTPLRQPQVQTLRVSAAQPRSE